jgi:hypothetical protein
MNDFSELEAELRQLRPAPVSVELSARIEVALTQTGAATAGVLPRPRQRRGFWSILALGLTTATALFLLGIGFYNKPSTQMSPIVAQSPASASSPDGLDSGLRPSALTRVVYHKQDEGFIFSPNQSEHLLRRVRYDTRETMQWRNPLTGASLRVSYPAEQVVLTPVSFQ